MKPLFDYQTDALTKLREAMAAGLKRVVMQMPTGSGKTRLAAEIVNGASSKEKRVIFEVPAISLVDQTVEMFYDEGIVDVGVIQAHHWKEDWSKPIQICSAQTLMKRGMANLPEADVVIRDECHKVFQFDAKWMLEERWRKVPFIGLSATPWTKGMGKIYEKLLVGVTTEQLIARGKLVPFKVFCPIKSQPQVDLTGVRTTAGDYNEADLSEVMTKNDKLTADIVETWIAKAKGRPTICFAVDRNHADSLRKRFEQAGIAAGYMDCETPLHERAQIRRDFESGRLEVVCNVEVIGMGVDWPEISCISYCRPTKSEIRFVQNIGRGLRTHPSKTDLLILDHSSTHQRLGFVTQVHHEHLNGAKLAATDEPVIRLPKECPACGYLKPYGKRQCPNCKFTSEPPAPLKENTAGTLGEFKGKKIKGTPAEKAAFHAELKCYAASKGYKPGWAANKYREKFDVWPVGDIKHVPPAATVSVSTRQWIQSRNIAWAKRKNPRAGDLSPAGEKVRQRQEAEQAIQQWVMQQYNRTAAAGPLVAGTLCTEDDLRDFA